MISRPVSTTCFACTLLILAAGAGRGQTTLSDLPLLGQYAVSRVIGNEESSYHATRLPDGFRLNNRRHGLAADFGVSGVEVRSETARFSLQFATPWL